MNTGLRIVLSSIGFVSLALGILGVFLPLLPTTPFLLLSAFCFSKSSPRFHSWLINHPILGRSIRDYQERGVIRLRVKGLVTLMMLGSALFVIPRELIPLWAKAGFGIVTISVLAFIWSRPGK